MTAPQRTAAADADREARTAESTARTDHVDVVVVGAGFAGMYMSHRLRELGFAFRVFETGDGVGGTWYWNRYPGARVDGDSLSYSLGFDDDLQQEWSWSEKYAPQPELLAYADHVADRFDLRRHIQFGTTVTQASYDDETERWSVRTDRGDHVSCRYLVTAVGCLSATNVPRFEGLDTFAGDWYHSSRWPAGGVDFTGRRVGVIGTGSTGIQMIPEIAKQAGQLFVFQRTANFAIPANNHPTDRQRERDWKADYPEHRRVARTSPGGHDFRHLGVPTKSALEVDADERERTFEAAWNRQYPAILMAFTDTATDPDANALLAEFVRNKIRAVVRDPAVAELLCPNDHPIGTKRIPLHTGYYETFNRPDVTLVDVRTDPIVRITPNGVATSAAEYELDTLVFATGFDAMTGPLLRMNITGAHGLRLDEKWAAGPRTYLGVSIAGFPNLFTITGPGSPSVLSNVITSLEQHVDWITDALRFFRQHGCTRVEATGSAEDAWVEHVNEVADRTLYKRANSWYMGANIPGKPRVFLPYVGGVGTYRAKCDAVAAAGYAGFTLTKRNAESPARR